MTLTIEVLEPGGGRPYLDGDALDRSQPLVFTVAGVLSPAECADAIARIDALGPTAAPITGARGPVLDADVRNNQRVMFDDPALAAGLFARLRPALPAPLCARRPVGLNERFRGYRYAPGQRFAPHYDGSFVRDAAEESLLTVLLFLNDGFVGGATEFLDLGVRVTPRPGLALLFQHRLLHEGCRVDAGTKYVLRTDAMYRASAPEG